jgi:hypothetical protein
MKLRPLSGSATIFSSDTTSPRLPVARRNTGASAVTVTDSLMSPTVSSKSSLIVSPVSIRTPSRRAVRNPASSTPMR